MSVQVKICGLTEEVGLETCLDQRVDWIGFNFFARSPRYVTPARAAQLASLFDKAPAGPGCVGLFVEPSDADIADVLSVTSLDVLQLYTSAERAREIRATFECKVWLSCPVSSETDLPVTTDVDRLIVESRPPQTSGRPGGNGIAFPWGLTREWKAPVPWLLAGGLRPENVAHAIAESGAAAVDVASGVESAPGIKDPEAIVRFVAAARGTVGA
ncbi:phosphoribosylanthranilate isomerase [Acetobacter fallax]|uniref:N-(5'-phosphoribosyl)anthranilate isomerase n=1 Tax=Acetobacter fallax TaxID=1737473 RepID=A0ABX0KGQ8_9PROT|nr:phosphoribosylanthranilate isomerase [Acetobacter fallax]NHO33107.1 N-(5'-phosphoribosyl)anthranilate isomerase [Acetobacter fallax]NHO36744.1 N-(5'-phosphoribosyl)anthranilate isomerase [Acetobacter fallax]